MASNKFRFGRGHESMDICIEVNDESVYPPSKIGRVFTEEVCKLDLQGKTFLDLGCGTGIVGIAAAMCGAIVTCTDVVEKATRCTVDNAKLNNVNVTTAAVDGFPHSLKKKYDVIVCNSPLPDVRLLEELIENGHEYLNSSGFILTWYCAPIDMEYYRVRAQMQWDYYEVLRTFNYNFDKIGKHEYTVDEEIEMLSRGTLVELGARRVSTAQLIRLENIS